MELSEMHKGERVINTVPENTTPEDDEVIIVTLKLGAGISVVHPKTREIIKFAAGTECAVVWQGRNNQGWYFYDCLLDTDLPVQRIYWNSHHVVTRQLRKKDDQLKLMVDKTA